MTDVKRLLAEATPLPWSRDEWLITDPTRKEEVMRSPKDVENAALIEYAVNHLPDYETAVDALEQLLNDEEEEEEEEDPAATSQAARAVLRRLRNDRPDSSTQQADPPRPEGVQ